MSLNKNIKTLKKVVCGACNNENCTCDFDEWMDYDYVTLQDNEEVKDEN